jgi:hypothetical protein
MLSSSSLPLVQIEATQQRQGWLAGRGGERACWAVQLGCLGVLCSRSGSCMWLCKGFIVGKAAGGAC